MSSTELELTLDRVPVEYPALVKEAVLNIHRSDVTSNCAALNKKYCWFLSKLQMFIWERTKSSTNRTSIPTQLPLAPSGLLQSMKCVVIYEGIIRKNTRNPSPGVLVVSPEGVLRHWTSIAHQNYYEETLELNSEVVLSVELVDAASEDSPASFILVTTSGTVYFLRGTSDCQNGALTAHKIVGKETQGIRRRLSSIVFGGISRETTSLVFQSFQYWRQETNDFLIVAVSPDVLTVFNINEKCELWSLKTKEFFHQIAVNFIESDIKSTAIGVKTTLVDAAPFREGLMILISASHQDSPVISLFLVYLSKDWQTEKPMDSTWSCRVPLPDAKSLFVKNDPTIFSNLTLCIPKRTAETKTSERTDGIIIVNPYFVQAMFVPDNLENSRKWELNFCKVINLPPHDQLIGVSINKQYCYILMLDSGVSTIRLLPKGFTEGTTIGTQANASAELNTQQPTTSEDWAVLSEILAEMVASGLPKTEPLQILHKSFELFGEKDMVKSSAELKKLNNLSDTDIAVIVEQFMYAIINYTDAANKTETEIQAKKVLCGRMILFLKHMGLFERISNAKIPNIQSRISTEFRTGVTMLAEMNERVAAANAIWRWRNLNDTSSMFFNLIIEKTLANTPEVREIGLSDKDAFFGRIGLLHHIPSVAFSQILEIFAKCRSQTQKYDFIYSVAELLITIKEGILSFRRSKCAIEKRKNWWTTDFITDVYRKVCQKIVEDLKEGSNSNSERARLFVYALNLYDFYLGEIDEQPDDDQILTDIILLGRVSEGLNLAEKHKDFGVLVKITLRSDKNTRQKSLNRLKKMYANDDFEMYLCQYLKNHGMNEVLLEQEGERVDAYLDNFKELRFSREISNKQYGKAAYTLMSLADGETKSFSKFADFLTRANFCARAADRGEDGVLEVLEFYKRRLPEMKHRRLIPIEVIRAGYGDDLDTMMSVDEMLEWNMTPQSSDEKTVEGYVRALHLLSDLKKVEESEDLEKRIHHTWRMLIDSEEWSRLKTREEVERKSIVGMLCEYFVLKYPNQKGSGFPMWLARDRLLIIPENIESIIEDCQEVSSKQASWIKGHVKWVIGELEKKASLPKSNFYKPDTTNTGSLTATYLDGFRPIMELLASQRRNRNVSNV